MPDNIGNQLQKIAQDALNNNLLKMCDELIIDHVKAIKKILEIPWAFRLGRDVYPKFLEGAEEKKENDFSTTLTLEETEWCMKRLMYTQLTLRKAFADLHEYKGATPEALKLKEYDELFEKITNGHQLIFARLKARRAKLQSNLNNPEAKAAQGIDQPVGGSVSLIDNNLDFLLGALDSASGHGPSFYSLWYAGPDYYQGYLAESVLEAIPKIAEGAASLVRETGQILVPITDAGFQDVASACGDCCGECKCDEDCCKCCGGGCTVCGGGTVKVAAGTGAGGVTIGSGYVDPTSAAQAATAHNAGLFSHAAWSKFFAFTVGGVVTLLWTIVAGLPALYNFGHSLFSKLIYGGEREATASRDRWSAASDLFCSTSLGALFFFSFLALLGPHAAITALILGAFFGDRASKYVRRSREREEMGDISKPAKWVPTKERIESLDREKRIEDSEPGASSELKQGMIQELLERKARNSSRESKRQDEETGNLTDISPENAKNVDEERSRLEAVSQTSYGCYRIAQKEKKAAVSRTDCYSALFSHYDKSKEYKKAVGFARTLNEEKDSKMSAADQFIRDYKPNRIR